MKPFHRDNTLFFFKLYPRTNGSFFSVERPDLGFHPQRPLFGVPLPPPLSQNFLEAGVGAGRWTGAFNPPQVGTHGLGLGMLGLWLGE